MSMFKYPNFSFLPNSDYYMKKLTPVLRNYSHNQSILFIRIKALSIFAIGVSGYYLAHIYRDWFFGMDFWKTRRQENLR